MAGVPDGNRHGAGNDGGGGADMRIASISIRGFRNIKVLMLEFVDATGKPTDKIILTGNMGCGKTTVLDAIHKLLSGGSSWGDESIGGRCVIRGRKRIIRTNHGSDTGCKIAYLSQYSPCIVSPDWITAVSHQRFVVLETFANSLGWKTWASDCRTGRLSSGQNALMKMAIPIACAVEPLDVALIDEPELHLNSSVQTHLMAALQKLSPTTQFIVATNSGEIMQSALTYERVVLENTSAAL